jgi:NAD(P)-dependent dehydrogenase (short-subunit alcohol dehydrogenase family)
LVLGNNFIYLRMYSKMSVSIFGRLRALAVGVSLLLVSGWFSVASADEAKKEALTVLITGANRGIGLEFAKQYQEAGFDVIGTARKPDEANELKATGARVMKLDITVDEDIASLAKALDGKKVDVLINNAGYMDRGLSRDALRRCFDVNAAGPLLLANALTAHLKLSENAKIINISSRLGIISNTRGSYSAYSMSKAALNMATRQLHEQLVSEGIIVVSMGPGHNQTDMGGKSAPLKPSDSVKLMMRVISSLTKEQSGRFWYRDGSELPW